MRTLLILLILAIALPVAAQRRTGVKRVPARSRTSLPTAPAPPGRSLSAELPTYRDARFGFQITFPETWTIAGGDFQGEMRAKGFDLDLKAPDTLAPQSKLQITRALQNVTVLVTAFRADARSSGAIVRASAEDLSALPQVRDAVDYFDLMRSQYRSMKLPAGFTYSETGAEKLGQKQFAFLDTRSAAGKKRIYATVKHRHALIFALSYRDPADLQAFRRIMSQGQFSLK